MASTDAAAEQRERILRVVAELIAKRGYADTSTDLIVSRAHVGYGTFYKFFADKEEAFLSLYEETFATTGQEIAAAYGDDGDPRPWVERISAAISTYYEAIAADPPLWRACLVEALTAGPDVLARHERSVRRLGGLLKPGRELSPDAAILPESLEDTIAGGIVWMAYQRLIVGEAGESLTALIPEAVQFALSPYIGEEKALEFSHRERVS